MEADPDRYGKCKELYCLRPKYAQGLCRKHYDQWRYFEGMIKPSTKTICDIFDCENRVCADGTCIPHNLEIRLQRKEDAIFRIFGMTLEDYSWLLYEEQKGICPPCLEIAPSLDEMLQNEFWPIDHDHACCPLRPTCGMCVRGIVCRTCNGALTKHWQDQEWRIRAIAYLGIRK